MNYCCYVLLSAKKQLNEEVLFLQNCCIEYKFSHIAVKVLPRPKEKETANLCYRNERSLKIPFFFFCRFQYELHSLW